VLKTEQAGFEKICILTRLIRVLIEIAMLALLQERKELSTDELSL